MFVIRMNSIHREYVATSSPYWINLLNDTTNKKQYADKAADLVGTFAFPS